MIEHIILAFVLVNTFFKLIELTGLFLARRYFTRQTPQTLESVTIGRLRREVDDYRSREIDNNNARLLLREVLVEVRKQNEQLRAENMRLRDLLPVTDEAS